MAAPFADAPACASFHSSGNSADEVESWALFSGRSMRF